MWYSTIYYNPPLPASGAHSVFAPNSCTLKNFAINANAESRSPEDGSVYGINIKGNASLIDSVWIEHAGAAIWFAGTNGTVQNNRIDETWAEGININNGNGSDPSVDFASNDIARNNFIRGSGDDSMAIGDFLGSPEVDSIRFVQNTAIAPWWGDCVGVWGGSNGLVANNLCTDSVRMWGIAIGVFGSIGDQLQSVWVQGNTILRGGSFGNGSQHAGIAVGTIRFPMVDNPVNNAKVRGNLIENAMFDGIDIFLGAGSKIDNNTMIAPALAGILIESGATGDASLIGNTVLNLKSGQSAYVDDASGFTVTGSGNIGFTLP